MIKHTQTVVTDLLRGVTGDSMRASIASLLNVPNMLTVPDFPTLYPTDWRARVREWLRARGQQIVIYTDDPTRTASWRVAGAEVFLLHFAPADRDMIASGKSPRGSYAHTIVWRLNDAVHDPYLGGPEGIDGTPWEVWDIR